MDVTVVGSIVVDLISYVERFPVVGETVFGYDFQKGFGGKGANQCVMAKMLGAKSSIIGQVGDDDFGREYIKRFKDLCINTDCINQTKSSFTGTASILVRKKDGANQIAISSGANFTISSDYIEQFRNIISESKVVLCQLEIPLEATYHALKIAKESDRFTILNPAPIPDSGLDLSQMPPVDIFCPNETEAAAITNIIIHTIDDAFNGIKFFFQHYSDKIRWPMITLGCLGVVYGDSNKKEIYHEPAPLVNTIDSTGAGDCFIGSLAYFVAVCSNLSFHEKVKRSIFLASLSVQKPGTQSSFPDNTANVY